MAIRNWAPIGASTDMNATANYDGTGALTGEDLIFNVSANNVTQTASLSVASITIGASCTGNFNVQSPYTLTVTGNVDLTNYTKTFGNNGILSIGGNLTIGTGVAAYTVTGGTTFTGTPTVNMGGKSTTSGRFIFNENATINAATTSSIQRVTLHAGSTYTITAGTTLTISTFTAGDLSGTAGNLVTLVSGTPGTTYILKFTVQPTCSYISVTDADSTTSAKVPLAFDGTSVHGSNVSGWCFDSVYYCDPAAAGTNDGSSWTNAWTSITSYTNVARCFNDICYARGLQNIASAGTLPTLVSAGHGIYPISIIGCNSSGTARAGQFTIQGTGGDLPVDLFNFPGAISRWKIENVTFDAATTQLVHFSVAATNQQNHFIHCRFINSSGYGVAAPTVSHSIYISFINCVFQSNTNAGAYYMASSVFIGCKFISNGFGILNNGANNVLVVLCVFHNNSDDDFSCQGGVNNWLLFNTFNGSIAGSCIKITTGSTLFLAMFNKLTSANQYGAEMSMNSPFPFLEDYNYFFGNGVLPVLVSGGFQEGTNDVNGANAGVASVASDDFRTAIGSLLRRVVFNLDWDLATASQRNVIYPSAGFPPDDEIKNIVGKLFNE